MLLLNKFYVTELQKNNELEDSFVLHNFKSYISKIRKLKHKMFFIHSFTQQIFIGHLLVDDHCGEI